MKDIKKRNTVIGWSLSMGGLVLMLCGGLLSIEIFARSSDPGIERFIEACHDSARQLGLSPRVVDAPTRGTILLSGETESPVRYIQQFNALTGFCPMHEINSMCAGAGCDEQAVGAGAVVPSFRASLSIRPDTPERGFFVKSQ